MRTVVLLALVATLLLSGCFAPSVEEVQTRWNEADATGTGEQYRIEFSANAPFVGEVNGRIDADPEAGRFKTTLFGLLTTYEEESSPELTWTKSDDQWYVERDYSQDDSDLDFSESITWTSKDGKTYHGTTDDGEPATLTVGKGGRFDTLEFDSEDLGTTVLTYSYENLPTLETPEGPIRATVDIDTPYFDEPQERDTVDIELISGAVKPSELEVHFLDTDDNVLRRSSWNDVLDADGFYFRFMDENSNGLVDEGDSYTYEYPNTTYAFDHYDLWADEYQGEVSVPALGPLALAVTLLGITWLHRRRTAP